MKFRELPPLPPASDPSKNDNRPSKGKKKRRSRHRKMSSKKSSLPTSTFHSDVWSVTSRGMSKEEEDFSSLSSVWT